MSERVVVTVVPAAVVVAVAWANGGYFPQSWGALLLLEALALVTFAMLATTIEVNRPAVALAAALVAFAVWEAVSRAWAVAPDGAILEAERTLVYAGGAAAAAAVVTRRLAGDLVLGVLAGAAAVTTGGLAQHVLGGGVPNHRFELPVGYANAAGMLAGTTLLLGLGLGADGPRWRRVACAASLPPAAAALYLSLSRGAMLAVALGLVALVVTTRSALHLGRIALAATPAALAVALAAGAWFAEPGVAASEVVSLAGIVGLMAAGGALAARRPAEPRLPTAPRRSPMRVAVVVGVVVLVGLVVAGAHEIRAVRSTPAAQQGAPDRLLSASTSYRTDYWRVAADMVEDEPLLGAGAGGFERTWLHDRPALLYVRDAHNLYLETLAELGPVGLALLLIGLLAPFVAAGPATRDPAGRAAMAGYVALLAHAGLDWDWELPVVALCTVLLGAATGTAGGGASHVLTRRSRSALLAGATLLGMIAIVVHTGNGATTEANDALDRGDAGPAKAEAERAHRFMPWAAEPWQLLGEAELAAGHLDRAREHIRRATREDPGSWSAWLALAQAAEGPERRLALGRARALNPLAPEIGAIAGDP